jgi:hypothetical protein
MNESFITDDAILAKVGEIMGNLKKNQQLQDLAKNNGLDVKNTIQYTDETSKNVAVGVISLMLAKRANDPDYAAVVRAGLSHRKCRCDVINKYKDQANQLIEKFKTSVRENLE